MDVYSDSKTDLKLQCDYSIKFQLFEGAQDVFSRLTAVCWMLLKHNLSTTRGMLVGHTVAVNIDFCGFLQFLSISFVWIIWVQYATDNLSGYQLEFAS
jgi:hypothetical protein